LELSRSGVRSALVCVDCDLYESAVPVFKFLDAFLQEGSVIYIDDFFTGYKGDPRRGVAGAFLEFAAQNVNWGFSEYLTVGAFGKSFISYRR